MQSLLTKLARGRKAIVAAAVQVGAVVVIFAPNWGHGVQVGLGLLSSLIALALVYRVPNRPSPELAAAIGRAKAGVRGGKRDGTLGAPMNEPHFEVFPETRKRRDAMGGVEGTEPTGQFVWHFQDANGRITFTGGEAFTRREDAHRSIDGVGDALDAIAMPPIVDLDADGKAID